MDEYIFVIVLREKQAIKALFLVKGHEQPSHKEMLDFVEANGYEVDSSRHFLYCYGGWIPEIIPSI